MYISLGDKTALVTGGDRGIGRGIVWALASAGANVVINYRTKANEAQATLVEVEKLGGQGIILQADVRVEADVDAMVETAQGRFGKIHILVNNAGINRDGVFMRMPTQAWDDVIDTTLKGAFFCSRALVRPMLSERWGRIINISSIVGVRGNSGQVNYATAKAGLIGFTYALAKEVGSRGVTVNALAPGFIADTDMTNAVPQDKQEAALTLTPMRRFGTVAEVAGTVVYLCSEAGAYTTGQVIGIDGGMTL